MKVKRTTQPAGPLKTRPVPRSKSPSASPVRSPLIPQSQLTPPKGSVLAGVRFSARGPGKEGQFLRKEPVLSRKEQLLSRTTKGHRQLVLDLDQSYGSSVENVEEEPGANSHRETDLEEECFGLSLRRVAELRSRWEGRGIGLELSEVLNMIKEEKLKVSEKLRILRKNNAYFRQRCQARTTADAATLSAPLLSPCLAPVLSDASTQVRPCELPPCLAEQATYVRLATMLSQMGIRCQAVLPEARWVQVGACEGGKTLSLGETIKIQQFFISKLASRLNRQ